MTPVLESPAVYLAALAAPIIDVAAAAVAVGAAGAARVVTPSASGVGTSKLGQPPRPPLLPRADSERYVIECA